MNADNPYTPPDAGKDTKTSRTAWLLLPVPFLICGAILYLSTFLRVSILHLLMIGVLPLGLSIASAVAISSFLVRPPWYGLLIAAYVISLYLMWSYFSTMYRLNPFP